MAEFMEREALLNEISMASTLKECVTIVRRFPAADVEPVRHGRWVLVNKAYDKYKCSNCGALDYITIGQKYCIYCGAKMDGGDNTER